MTELSLNILDIANNSTRAGADNIIITIKIDTLLDLIHIEIQDDGSGMSSELLQRVTDPFATTRTTRKVGLGLGLLKMGAEMCGGGLDIKSTLGVGTTVMASYQISHIDRPPLGDVASTIVTLIGGAPKTDFVLNYIFDAKEYVFDTREVKEALGEDDLSDITILNYLKEMIEQNLENVNGGYIL